MYSLRNTNQRFPFNLSNKCVQLKIQRSRDQGKFFVNSVRKKIKIYHWILKILRESKFLSKKCQHFHQILTICSVYLFMGGGEPVTKIPMLGGQVIFPFSLNTCIIFFLLEIHSELKIWLIRSGKASTEKVISNN